jgi:hypothetical protein
MLDIMSSIQRMGSGTRILESEVGELYGNVFKTVTLTKTVEGYIESLQSSINRLGEGIRELDSYMNAIEGDEEHQVTALRKVNSYVNMIYDIPWHSFYEGAGIGLYEGFGTKIIRRENEGRFRLKNIEPR